METNWCHNYRGISLLWTRYKILTTYLNNRFKQYADHETGECQAGFSVGKSTTDEIFWVKNLLEKSCGNTV